jgi:hypothetical protein
MRSRVGPSRRFHKVRRAFINLFINLIIDLFRDRSSRRRSYPRLHGVVPSETRGSGDTDSDMLVVHSLRTSVLSRTIPASKSHPGQDGNTTSLGLDTQRCAEHAHTHALLGLRGCTATTQRRVQTTDTTRSSRRSQQAQVYEGVQRKRRASTATQSVIAGRRR